MKKTRVIAGLLLVGSVADAYAEQPITRADSSRVIDMEEVVVIAAPKETQKLRNQAMSVSILGRNDLKAYGAQSVRGLSGYTPNFYSPDYGSRLTSAMYVRGVGSRVNTPAVGLYVDNVPYIDKSSYDFHFLDVDRVDILRGPQGTLYGRNTMGGLIRVYSKDPMAYSGTDVSIGSTTKNGARRGALTTYLRPSEKFAASVGAFYDASDGFFKNDSAGKRADGYHQGGGKLRFAYRPLANLRFDLMTSYEYITQGATPYYYRGMTSTAAPDAYASEVGHITSNRPGTYRRNLWNNNLGIEWTANRFVMSSYTSFQALEDRLMMDQDFISADIFTLTQRQKQRTVTEELTFKSHNHRYWDWATGAFFLYQQQRTNCPVEFFADGMSYLNYQMQQSFANQKPAMSVTFTDPSMTFTGTFRTPTTNAAVFHQSTFKNLLVDGLSLTIGARMEYDRQELRLNSGTAALVNYVFAMPSYHMNKALTANPLVTGHSSTDTWQLLPKFALQYDFHKGLGNVYASVSKGYRSGGYNIQEYSDLAQAALTRSMMDGIKTYSVAAIDYIPGLTDDVKQHAKTAMASAIDKYKPAEPQVSTLRFKPETSWNYEVGTHLNLWDKTLQVDASAFFMQLRNQQITRFAGSGLGRTTVNAGRSQSCGAEISVRWALLDDHLKLTANYGYTYAVFKKYDGGYKTTTNATGGKDTVRIDYKNNRVPFTPEQTFAVAADYTIDCSSQAFRSLVIGANFTGNGRIYWNEENSMSQGFYATLGAHVTLNFGRGFSLDVWGKNLTNRNYDLFSFTSMGRKYAQISQPVHFGADLSLHF